MFKQYSFNNIKSKHYLNPGENLNDLDLMRLHNSLVSINQNAKAQVDNLYLRKNLKLSDLREVYATCAITLIEDELSPFGFLISPIISSEVGHIFHGGLIIFNRNPGGDFMSLTALCNASMAYEKYGTLFATNISSTPSIIEVFTNTISQVWPSPKINLKVIPKDYKVVVQALKNQYMDKYFPENSNVIVDDKRFTMSSNSTEMGFSTDYYKLSRANKYIFQAFCKIWVNYEESEDIIQVGKVTFLTYLQQKIKLEILKMKLKRVRPKSKIGLGVKDKEEQRVA